MSDTLKTVSLKDEQLSKVAGGNSDYEPYYDYIDDYPNNFISAIGPYILRVEMLNGDVFMDEALVIKSSLDSNKRYRFSFQIKADETGGRGKYYVSNTMNAEEI